MASHRRRQIVAARQALDEARFGAARTLNLRASLPSAREATTRAEAWLRQRQVEGDREEVLVITGRGEGSPGGVSVVREAIGRLLVSLRRRGVVASHRQHTAGSFVVQLAPMSALWDAPRRRREQTSAPVVDPPALAALAPETRALLRALAVVSLESLGVRDTEPLLEGEMLKQFAMLAAAIPATPDREACLRAAVQRAIEEYVEEG